MTNTRNIAAIFLFSWVGVWAGLLQAQHNSKNPYPQKDLESFARVFTESKMQETGVDVTIISLLQEYNISYGRYRDILTNQIEGKNTDGYSENEKKFFEAVKAENAALAEKIKSFEQKRCEELGILHARYLEIKQQFLQSPAFQNEIYPVFQKLAEDQGDK